MKQRKRKKTQKRVTPPTDKNINLLKLCMEKQGKDDDWGIDESSIRKNLKKE